MNMSSPSGIRLTKVKKDEEAGAVGDKEVSQKAELEPESSPENDEEAIEASEEKREVIKMADPRQPSEEERREHNLARLPFRNWCPHCVRGRGREADHKKFKEQAEGLHEFHFDFVFMGPENQPGKTLTILVVTERRTKMVMATAAPSKSTRRFVVERVGAFIKELGIDHLDIVAKSDQEPPITQVVEDVGKHRGEGSGMRITEFSPVNRLTSNGVERGIQSVQGQVRVLKDALEAKWKMEISAVECVVFWIVEWAAHTLN